MSQNRLKPGAMKTISDNKLATFVIGQQKKTRFQKEKEAREARKKAEMAEAADIYEEFVASFEGGDDDSKTFVRGGTYYKPQDAQGVVRRGRGHGEKGDAYVMEAPGARKQGATPPKKPMSEMERLLEEMKEKNGPKPHGGGAGAAGGRPKRAIDSFLDEIKTRQTSGGDYRETNPRGSFDDGDPETTNLYVGNLAPTITEEVLNDAFCKFGQIYSVKIMWPRTEEERARKRNCGFVSFMYRPDAEDAKNAMHDMDLEGYRISVGWGKAIKKLSNASTTLGAVGGFLKPKADALPPGLPREIHQKIETAVKKATTAAEKKNSTVTTRPVGKASNWDAAPVEPKEREMGEADTKIQVVPPADRDQRDLLDRLARYVSKDGQPLENIIKEREANNPKYKCLREPTSEEGIYYRWKVFSLVMGDRERRWREKPFQMTLNGPFWVPPKMSRRDEESDDEEERERERERRRQREREQMRKERYKFSTGAQLEKAREAQRSKDRAAALLSGDEIEEFRDKLRALTQSRQAIKETMGFALDRAEASEFLVSEIEKALLDDRTPLGVKVAHLYLVSDILHNSSAPVQHASTYRTHIQHELPRVFEHLNKIYRDTNRMGRMTAKNLEEKVMKLLTIWEQWSLYPPMYISGLEATFQRRSTDLDVDLPNVDEEALNLDDLKRKAKQTGIYFDEDGDTALRLLKKLNQLNVYMKSKVSAMEPVVESSPLSAAIKPLADSATLAGSVPNGGSGNINPEVSVQTRGAWGSVVDEPSAMDEDVDGVAMDDDVDGAPMDDVFDVAPVAPTAHTQGTKGVEGRRGAKKRGREQNQDRSDHLSDSSDEEESGPGKIDFVSESAQSQRSLDDTERAILRRVETQLIQLRDQLEAEGKPASYIDDTCAEERTRLLKQYRAEASGGPDGSASKRARSGSR